MFASIHRIVLASLVMPALFLCGTAAGATGGTVKIVSVEVKAFDRLVEMTGKPGEMIIYGKEFKSSDEQILVGVKAEVEGTFDASSTKIEVPKDESGLYSGATACKAVGRFTDEGIALPGDLKLNIYQPLGGKKEENGSAKVKIQWAFYAPKKSSELTLKIGSVETKVKVPAEVTKNDGTTWINAKIDSATLIDQIPQGGNLPALKNPDGKLLMVRFTYTPKRSSDPAKGFAFNASQAGARVNGKDYGCAGAVVNNTVSTPFNWNYYVKEPFTKPRTEVVLFMVPADSKEIELLWLGSVVASGKIGG